MIQKKKNIRLCIIINAKDISVDYRAESAPTIDDYDFNCTLPLTDEAMAEMLSYLDTMVYENDTTADRSSYINERPDRYTCFYTSNFLNR